MTKNSFFFNGCFDKNRIKSLISWSLRSCGEKITIDLLENLKTLGFAYATEAGISLGIDDLKIPPTKAKFILEADVQIKLTQINYKKSYLTGIEKFQQLIDTWHRTSETLKQNVIHYFRSTDILNPVYMMAFSGARGNISQVRQLVGMRGLMSDPQGQILDFPIKSNFREGLTLTEYIISCYGARKGLVDTALKTANSGYLTRRLVDVSHHIIISDFDCKTQHGIVLNNITENQKIIVPLQKRLIGRILAKNIYSKNETARRVVSPIFLGNLPIPNSTAKISNISKMKQKLAFTKPLLNTNSLQSAKSENLFPTQRISNVSDIHFNQKNNNGRVLALFCKLMVSSLSKKNSNTKSTEEILVVKKESLQTVKQFVNLNTSYFGDFYWHQLVFSLNHVIFAFTNQTLIASKNEEISVSLAVKIATLKKQVLVRSPLTCEIKNSLCQLCYGWSLAHGKLVSLGEAVGIIAAQSIGEPGTQLTMRTFHTGGVFSGDIMSEIRAPFNGMVEFPEFFQGILIRTPHGKIAFLTKVPGNFQVICKQNTQFNLPETNKLSPIGFGSNQVPLQVTSLPKGTSPQVEINTKHHENTIKTIKNVTFEIPAFTVLFIRNKEHVIKTQLIAEFSSISANRNQRIKANHDLNAELEGEVYFENITAITHTKKEKIINRTTYALGSIWIVSGQIYQQPVSFTLFPQSGDLVNLNSIMGQYSSMSPYNGVLKILPNVSNKITSQATNEVSRYLKTKKIEQFKKKPTSFFSALQSKASCNYKMNTLGNTPFFLNHTLISFSIKCIQYKKIGYFLSFSNAQSLLSLDSFFLSNSLKQNFKNSTKLKTSFYFQSFPKQYQTETGGIVICDNFYRNEKLGSGEVFWISEETYTFSSWDLICFHFKSALSMKNLDFHLNSETLTAGESCVALQNKRKKLLRSKASLRNFFLSSSLQTNYKKWINKKNSLIFYTNSQGKISSFSSKLGGYIQSNLNFVLSNNKKTQFGAIRCLKPRVKTQRKNLHLSLVAQKKANKMQNIFFAYNFFDNQNFYKKTAPQQSFAASGSKILSQFNLENKKCNTLTFRLNPLSFYNAKYKKLYFVLFKTTRSCILQPQFAWGINKKQCNLPTQSNLLNKFNKNTPLINLLKITTFNSKSSKQKNTLNLPYFGNNLSKISQNFFQRKKLCLFNKKNKFKLKIKPGWVYFPTNIKKTIPKQKSVVQPGVVCFDDILFDQYSVYFECFSFTKFYNENLGETNNFEFQTKIEKNTSLKYTLNFQYVSNEFNLSKNNKVFSNAILTKPNIYSFFANIHSSKFFSKNFYTFISKFFSYTTNPNFRNKIYKTSNHKKILRNKKLLLNHFIKKNVFSLGKQVLKGGKNSNSGSWGSGEPYHKTRSVQVDKLQSSLSTCFTSCYSNEVTRPKKKFCSEALLQSSFFKPKKTSETCFQGTFALQSNGKKLGFFKPLLWKAKGVTSLQNALFKKDKKNYNYNKIYFLQIFHFPRKQDRTVLNNGVLPILMPLKTLFSFQLTIKSIPESNEKQFTRIKTQFIPKFFVLIRKLHSFSFISSVKYKTLLSQQNQHKLYSLVTQNKKNESKIHFIYFSWFNQQKITQLFFNYLSPDFSIKPYFPYKGYRKSIFLKNTIILKFFILFLIPKHYAFNIVQIKFISKTENTKLQCQSLPFLYTPNSRFKKNKVSVLPASLLRYKGQSKNQFIFHLTWYLNFSILRELKFSNQLSDTKFNTKGEKNTVLVYSKNAISLETPISFTRFFSPFQGELLNTQVKESERVNQNYLILTDKDQVTFSLNYFPEKEILRFDKSTQIIKDSNNKKIVVASLKAPSPNFLGSFIDYGTKIENLAIPESGQIIQIHKSKIVVRKVQPILFSRKGILSVYNGDIIEKNSLVLSLFYQRLKTGDIVQGIPKIEQLFEARKTNQGEIVAGSVHEKLESVFKYYKKKYNPEIAARFSLTKIQQIIVNKVQQVYQSQGVTIAEKHLEIIIRQMTSKVEIINGGTTNLLRGEIVDLDWIEMVNKGVPGEKAQYKPVILGITKKSLETKSFISAASFQETTRILTKAAVERKTDFLKGLKENVILGHVIPAGTGFSFSSGKILNTNQLKFSGTNKSYGVFKDIFPKLKITKKQSSQN